MTKITIAIDGFSGCGKSSTAKEVARRLRYKFIDTGAMYRAVTLYFIQNQVNIQSRKAVIKALDHIRLDFRYHPETGKNELYMNGQNVEQEVRKMYVSEKVSAVSAIREVRKAMVAQQQEMGKNKGVVMDGRDIGSVVFPGAELKLFMTAGEKVRAERRLRELREKGEEVSLDEIIRNFRARDRQDTTRKESPLIRVPDAVDLDTSHMKFGEQVQKVLDLARERIERLDQKEVQGSCK